MEEKSETESGGVVSDMLMTRGGAGEHNAHTHLHKHGHDHTNIDTDSCVTKFFAHDDRRGRI